MTVRSLLLVFKLTFLVLCFYQIARLEFLIWNWSYLSQEPFDKIAFAWLNGLRFDISGALLISVPWILGCFALWGSLGRRLAPAIWWGAAGFHSLFFILCLVDVEFIHFIGRRSTADTLIAWQEVPGKMGGFLETYWHLYLTNAGLFLLFWWGAAKLILADRNKDFRVWQQIAIAVAVLLVSVIGIRGGLQNKPISFVNANLFTNFYLNNLVLNSSFTFAKSLKGEGLKKHQFFADQNGAFKRAQFIQSPSPVHGLLKGSSVVLIILESFGTEYTGSSGGPSYTPFLDSLKDKSLSFPRAYASGRRSIEGIASLLTGLPVLMSEPFISSKYAAQPLLGLPEILKERSYTSRFFHGGLNGTMHFDSFAASIGFDAYYGFNEYGKKDFDGTWGAWDRPFFQEVLKETQKMPRPFLSTLFSLSSHHPFRVPEAESGLYQEGPLPILKPVQYTDSALREFFAEAEKQDWYAETLFVITADHTSTHYLTDFTNLIGSYEVPLLFFHPSKDLKKYQHTDVVSHVDVMPTILDLLGLVPPKTLPYGSSVFHQGPGRVSTHFLDGQYLLFSKDYYIVLADWEKPKVFSKLDRSGSAPLQWKEEFDPLFEKLKAQVQYFNNGLEENQLYLPSPEVQ